MAGNVAKSNWLLGCMRSTRYLVLAGLEEQSNILDKLRALMIALANTCYTPGV